MRWSWPKCARGTPRIANRLLKRVRDFATVEGDGAIDGPTAVAARRQMDIDELGLDELDRSVLRAIIELYGGGPVGWIPWRPTLVRKV